jgi:pyruvate dehydrogenase (quinone)
MLSQPLEHEGPVLMNVAMNRQELLVPPSINLAQIKRLILYMIKAVLNGKGDEVVDLARTNLFM